MPLTGKCSNVVTQLVAKLQVPEQVPSSLWLTSVHQGPYWDHNIRDLGHFRALDTLVDSPLHSIQPSISWKAYSFHSILEVPLARGGMLQKRLVTQPFGIDLDLLEYQKHFDPQGIECKLYLSAGLLGLYLQLSQKAMFRSCFWKDKEMIQRWASLIGPSLSCRTGKHQIEPRN